MLFRSLCLRLFVQRFSFVGVNGLQRERQNFVQAVASEAAVRRTAFDIRRQEHVRQDRGIAAEPAHIQDIMLSGSARGGNTGVVHRHQVHFKTGVLKRVGEELYELFFVSGERGVIDRQLPPVLFTDAVAVFVDPPGFF